MRITLSERRAPLLKVLIDIQQKTGIHYNGEGNWPRLGRPVSIDVVDEPIDNVLALCFKDQPLSYDLNLADRYIFVKQRPVEERRVHGWVLDENRDPLGRVSIHIAGEGDALSADNGEFELNLRYAGARLVFSMVGYAPKEMDVPVADQDLMVQMESRVGALEIVTVHTGYQDQHKLKTTGSFAQVDNDLFNRRVAPNVLDHIDGVTSGVLFNKNLQTGLNQSSISVRGRSTIFANPNPLIVVDNFPYNGDVNNINPADVDNITVLKDAASAAIWGAFAGNGVIVITTKRAREGQSAHLSFTTSQTVEQRLNLFYQPVLSSGDYIDIEQFLFGKGYYDGYLNSPFYPALTPVVEWMDQAQRGILSGADAQARIDALRKLDSRNDLNKYFYRRGVRSQYALSISGGSERDQYYLSAGYDRNLTNLTHNDFDRITLFGNNSYTLLPKKLVLTTNLAFAGSTTYLNNQGGAVVNYPYASLADSRGNALPVAYNLRLPYADTAGGGRLLDWHYRPLDELNRANDVVHMNEYRINLRLRYTILKGLEAQAYYQYSRSDSNFLRYFGLNSFFTRNLVNSFTQRDSAGNLSYPVPRGGIQNENLSSITSNNARLLLSYNDSLFRHGVLNLIGGVEVRDIEMNSRANWLYGYNPDVESSTPPDYVHIYPNYTTGIGQQLAYQDFRSGTAERYFSYYGAGSYSWRGRYLFSASTRRDESNLFGVRANQKGVPLWSIGVAWELSKESFYRPGPLPFMRLRVSDGYNGNIDRSVSAYTTAVQNVGLNPYNNVTASIINPPNPSLRWERVHILNAGIDFATKENRLSGTIEYFYKSGLDLIGLSPVDPTTGVSLFQGNTANMANHGVDLTLQFNSRLGPVSWSSVWLFSYVRDEVTRYLPTPGSVQNYLGSGMIVPLKGRPLYSILALRWMGLSPANGDPQGYFQGKPSTGYANILSSDSLQYLLFKGAVNPTVFGSWRNNFYWKQWELSFNIIYKAGYAFRRSSIFYYSVFAGGSQGHPDYARRWRNPGDEKRTNVPSMDYPADPNRDEFYQASEVLVERGDHIRFQDLQIGYKLERSEKKKLPVQAVKFYLYANNLGILWKGNHVGLDPDYAESLPSPRTLSLGMKIDY